MMSQAKLFHYSNDISRSHARELIKKYGSTMQEGWNVNTRILDVGCGDGAVTKLLTTHLSAAQWSACDISLEMIKFAKQTYSESGVEFFYLNLRDEIEEKLRAEFDCVFCLFVLHRIQDQRVAFSNIHSLLKTKSRCLVSVMCEAEMFDLDVRMAKNAKWSPYIKDVRQLISPYYGDKNPEESVKTVMLECGFQDVAVATKKIAWPFYDIEKFRNLMKSVDPCIFVIPPELHEDYLDDYLKMLAEDGGESPPYYYRCSVVEAIAIK